MRRIHHFDLSSLDDKKVSSRTFLSNQNPVTGLSAARVGKARCRQLSLSQLRRNEDTVAEKTFAPKRLHMKVEDCILHFTDRSDTAHHFAYFNPCVK